MGIRKYFRLRRLRSIRTLIALIIILVLVAGIWAWRNHKSNSASTAKPADTSNPSAVNQDLKDTGRSGDIPQGTASDSHGSAATDTSPNQWVVSQSGAITVKQPAANSTFKSGGTVVGSSTLNQVQYRIIDSQVGKIAEGPISVVNGSFSATLNFTAYGTKGEIDVFSYDPSNAGAEINEVQISVNLK